MLSSWRIVGGDDEDEEKQNDEHVTHGIRQSRYTLPCKRGLRSHQES